MRKNLFIYLILIVSFLSGCNLFNEDTAEETIRIQLPSWQTEPEYPPLSRWKITLAQNTGIKTFHCTPGSTIKITTQKNCPFSIQALPVTLLNDGNECTYFHPAGFIYPSENPPEATWEQGYTAFIMESLYRQCQKNGFSAPESARYVSTFNWAKMNAQIQEKITKSIQDEKKFYNPWLCDTGRIIKNLCDETFRTSLLTPSNCYQISTAALQKQYGISVLSPFIPENQTISKTGQITIKKDNPIFLSDAKEFGLFISYLSAKNVQIEYIYIPIYKEEI